MDRYEKITRWIAEAFAVTIFTVILFLQATNIFLRYTAIAAPLMWVEEFTRYAFIWIVFLVWHLSDRTDAHFHADFATSAFGNHWKRWLNLFQHLIVVGFAVLTVWSSIRYIPATLSYTTNSFPWLPMGMVYLVIPIGLTLVGIERLRMIHRIFFGEKEEVK